MTEDNLLSAEEMQLFGDIWSLCESWHAFAAQPRRELSELERLIKEKEKMIEMIEQKISNDISNRLHRSKHPDFMKAEIFKQERNKLVDQLNMKKRPVGERQKHNVAKLVTMMGEIRRLYREACEEAVAARENVLRARLPVESTQLALQNQTYERNHLVAEVERCRAFRSIYQDAELHTVDEFFALAPPEETDPSVVYDEHSTMIARLKFELSERERLAVEQKALLAEKAEASRIAKQKKAGLMRLEPDLANIINAAKPIGEALDKFLA